MGIFSFFKWGNEVDPLDTANKKIQLLEQKLQTKDKHYVELSKELADIRMHVMETRTTTVPYEYLHRCIQHVVENYNHLRFENRQHRSEGWHRCELRFPKYPDARTSTFCGELEPAEDIEIIIIVFYAQFFKKRNANEPFELQIRFGESTRNTIVKIPMPAHSFAEWIPMRKIFNRHEITTIIQALNFMSAGSNMLSPLIEDMMNLMDIVNYSNDDFNDFNDGMRSEQQWLPWQQLKKLRRR
jgi:hypothetical protein